MRFRNWIMLEVICGIGLAIFGNIIKNDSLFTLGVVGTMLPLFHNLIGSTFWFEYKLKKDNKYAVEVLCQNCQVYTLFRIVNGVSVETAIRGKICQSCNNEFKLQEEKSVKHE